MEACQRCVVIVHKGEGKEKKKKGWTALNHQAPIQEGSRGGSNCLSELPALRGIWHMPTPPLPFMLTRTDTHIHSHPLLHPHHKLAALALGNRWQHMGGGGFHRHFWPHELSCVDLCFHYQFNRVEPHRR